MDFDRLVTDVAGAEGVGRYRRLGLVMVLAGLLCTLVLLKATLYDIEGDRWTYGELSAAPDEAPMYIPNDEIVSHANVAIVGFVLLTLVGVLFMMEGAGVVRLRRYMVWHSEVRATVLYALALLVSLVGVVASGTMMSLSYGEPTIQQQGMVAQYDEVTAVAPVWTLAIGAIVAMGMLLLTYHSSVLSIYRGGYTSTMRRVARLAFVVSLVAFVGVLLLHSMNVMVVDIKYEPEAGGFSYNIPYTKADIDYLVSTNQAEDLLRSLDARLEVLVWSLLVLGLFGLLGMVGASGWSLNEGSRKARRAIATFALSAAPAAVALWAAQAAGSTVLSFGGGGLFYVIEPYVGTPVFLGFWGGIVLVALALVALYFLRPSFVVEALTLPREAAERVPVPNDGVPEVGAVQGAGLRPRVAPARRRGPTVMLSVVVVVVVVVAAVGLASIRGGDGGGDGGAGPSVDLADMDAFERTSSMDTYLEEGQEYVMDAASTVLGDVRGDVAYFFRAVYVHLSWVDEPDQGLVIDRWENQPDTFELVVTDREGLNEVSVTGSNPRGGAGDLELLWAPMETWVAIGNSSLVDPSDVDVAWNDDITIVIHMERAGDLESPIGRTRSDGGNAFTVTVEVAGHQFP